MSTLGRNIAFPIYKGNGSSFHNLVIRKSTSDSVVMSLGDKVTGDVYYKDNTLVCDMDEYIMVDGVKYSIVNPPTIVREGLKSDNGDLKGMTKYSFEFYHPMYMLGNMAFSDVAVTNAESMFKSHDRSFSWIGNLTDYVAKLNKNLQGSQFIVSISSSIDNTSRAVLSDVLTFSDNTIADALKTCYDTWHYPFVVDAIKSGEQYYSSGKRFLIQFGNPTREILDTNNEPFVFQFGKGVGLKNNSRTPRNNKIVTRVAGYGSEQNIPYGYPQIPWTGDPSATTTADGYPIYEGIVGGVVTKLVKHPFTRTHLMPSVYSESVRKKVNSAASDYDNTTPLVDYYDAPSSYPNPINLDAPRLDIVSIETIKPELGDMAILGATPVNDDLTPASGWDDTMDDDGNYLQSYFKITLPQLDFDIYACASITEEMKINMRSGACIGCTFDAQVDWDDYKKNFFDAQGNFLPNGEQRDLSKYPKSNNGSIDLIVKKDLNTYGMLMPNVYQQPAQGDKFVILGISMPSTYITNAEERLDAALMTHMLDNNVYYYDYPLKFDEDFFYNNTDILSQVRPNSVLRFTFGGEEKSLYIKQITIKYGEGVLPKYDITLTDNIEVVLNQIGLVADDVSRLALAMMQMNKRTNINISNTESLQKYVDYTIMPNLESIQRQIDGSQVTYFGNEDPFDSAHPYSDGKYIVDPTKFPASEWDDDYSEHDGDMFYNRETGKGYEFTIIDNSSSPVVYGWQLIQDEDIIQALNNAQTAQDTADGKRRVFICDASHHTPNPPYDVGDLWVNVKYPYSTGATYDDEILKCVVAKTEGQSFSINDWSLANGYTAALRNFINGTYADDLEDIQNQIDGKAETWYQNTDPSTAWTTTALKNQHKGDIWHNSSTTTINGVKAGQDAIWDGTQWVVDETVPSAVYDEIDGKCAIYVSWGAWGDDLQEKDLFIPAGDVTIDGVTYKENKVYRCVDKDTPLFQEIAYTDDTQYNGFITKLIGSSGQTKDAAENAIAAIKHALNEGNTYNEGGLILSNLISLGTGNPTSGTFTPWAGISGIYKTSETGTGYKGHGIAAWFGGGMVDGEVSQSATNAAKSLFRFDGSGYVAGGNLSWDKNGNVTIQGYSINATTLQVGGSNVATESSISTFFANFFDIYNGSTQITYAQYVALQDKSNVSIKAKYGLWTEQFLSALGLNSQGGGTGGGGVSSIRVSSSSVITPDTDGIVDLTNYVSTANERNAWNNASSMAHTHSNKSVLDGITSAKVTSWDAVAAIMGEDPDEIINKWNEIIAFLLNIPEQTTLEQLLAAKANSTVQIIAGNGLTGGGNLQDNRTLAIQLQANSGLALSSSGLKLDVVNTLDSTLTYKALSAAQGKSLNDRLAVLESWFEVDANGDIKTKNTAGGHVRGFYTESFVSALGSNSSGGGGGGDVSSVMFDTSISYHTGTPVYTATDGVIHLPPYPTSVAWANVTGKPSWIGSSKPTYAIGEIQNSALSGNGFLKKTGTNTWGIDTNTYITGNQTITLSGDVSGSGATSISVTIGQGKVTNAMLAGSIANSKLQNSSVTVNGTSVSLGDSITTEKWGTARNITIKDADSTNSGTAVSVNGSAAVTLLLPSTIKATLSGNASSATLASTVTTTADTTNTLYVVGVTSSATTTLKRDTSITVKGGALSAGSVTTTGNVSIGGTLGVTGAATLSSSLSVASGITLTTTKKIYFGDTSHYIELTSTGFHFTHGIYSDSFVSALGANSSGGGGGADLGDVWDSLTNQTGTTPTSTTKIAVAHIPDISSTYGYVKTSQMGSYLPLTGGTMTGNVTFNGVNKGIYLTDSGGNTFAGIIQNSDNLWIGAQSTTATHHSGSTYISAGSGDVYVARLVSGTRTGYKVLDSGNYSSYALPLSGGTITGSLTVNNAIYATAILEPVGDNGLLVYHPSSGWGGISNTQWGVGTTESQGVIRSSNANLIHYKGGTNYTICDGSNTYVSSGKGYINGTEITTATKDGSGNTITSTYLTAIGRSGDYITQTKGGTTSNVTKIFERRGTYSHAISEAGWYRVGRFLSKGSGGSSCIMMLSKTFANNGNVAYVFSITLSYMGGISITQLAGDYYSTSLIDKIRVEYLNNNDDFYPPIDIHISTTTSATNTYYVTFIGGAQALSEYEKDPTLTGSTFEFTTTIGTKAATPSTHSTHVCASNSNGAVSICASTNRGLLDVTNNAWIVGTNGTNTWLSQGNVGIGNTDPAYTLDVNGSTYSYGYIYLGRNNYGLYTKDSGGSVRNTVNLNSSNQLLIGYGTGGAGYETHIYGGSIYLRYGTSRTIGVTLASSGSVTFAGTIEARTNAYNYTTDATSYGLNMHNSDLVGVNGIFTSDTADAWTEGINFKRTDGKWDSLRAKDGEFLFGSNSGTEAIGIKPSGASVTNGVFLYGSTYTVSFEIGSGNVNRGIYDYTSGINKWLLYFNASNTILNFGNVGIGTTTPGYKLGVVGTVGISSGHLYLTGASTSSSTANTTQIIFTASSTQQVAISSNSSALIINPTSSTTTGQVVLGVGTKDSTFGTNIISKGEVTAQSDARKKNIISDTKFNVKDIASAKSVLFEWSDGRDKDKEKKIHGGSIAQDWLGKADSFLMQDEDGFYSINYGALALCSAITIAREVLKHSDEIDRLKQEVSYLKARVAELEERRA